VREVPDAGGTDDRAADPWAQVRVGGGVVVAHPREEVELEGLVAAGVVDHPVPVARDGGQPLRRDRVGLEERAVDGEDGRHLRAPGGQLGGGGRVEQHRHLAPGDRGGVPDAVLQRLDGVAQLLGVEEVDERAVGHRRQRRSGRNRVLRPRP
jgi:hypothetical protein